MSRETVQPDERGEDLTIKKPLLDRRGVKAGLVVSTALGGIALGGVGVKLYRRWKKDIATEQADPISSAFSETVGAIEVVDTSGKDSQKNLREGIRGALAATHSTLTPEDRRELKELLEGMEPRRGIQLRTEPLAHLIKRILRKNGSDDRIERNLSPTQLSSLMDASLLLRKRISEIQHVGRPFLAELREHGGLDSDAEAEQAVRGLIDTEAKMRAEIVNTLKNQIRFNGFSVVKPRDHQVESMQSMTLNTWADEALREQRFGPHWLVIRDIGGAVLGYANYSIIPAENIDYNTLTSQDIADREQPQLAGNIPLIRDIRARAGVEYDATVGLYIGLLEYFQTAGTHDPICIFFSHKAKEIQERAYTNHGRIPPYELLTSQENADGTPYDGLSRIASFFGNRTEGFTQSFMQTTVPDENVRPFVRNNDRYTFHPNYPTPLTLENGEWICRVPSAFIRMQLPSKESSTARVYTDINMI